MEYYNRDKNLGYVFVICAIFLQTAPVISQVFLGQIGTKIYFSLGRSTWIESVEGCHAGNMMMGTIDNLEENAFVASFLHETTDPKWFWLPMADFFGEGNFIWLHNGKNITETFNNWEAGEPKEDLSSNCGFLYHHGKWGVTKCPSDYPSGLCQVITK